MEFFKYGETEIAHLKRRDKKLGLAIERIGLIQRQIITDLFAALVHSIVGQQISTKAAATVWKRLQEYFCELTPQKIAAATAAEIQQCGLSMRKASYIKGIGEAIVKGELVIDAISELSDGEIIERLSALNGIGIWTAEMLLIFSLERPDVVSWGDLAIRRGIMRLYGLKKLDKAAFERYKRRYSPYGSVASLYLWAVATEPST